MVTEPVPGNVSRFETFLYSSLLLDTLSAAFIDRPPEDTTPDMLPVVNLTAAFMIVSFTYLIWLAARRRQNWARWALVVALGLSVILLMAELGQDGLQLRSLVEIISCALTAAGLYYSFTGNAKDWFKTA